MRWLPPILLVLVMGCGARTGVSDGDGGPRMDAGSDARPPIDAFRPDRFEPEDAGEPVTCDGRPLPRAGDVSRLEVPLRAQGLGTRIPDPEGLLVVGGRTSVDTFADRMVFVDRASRTTTELPVLGDRVDLPLNDGIAVYVRSGDRVVVVGGTVADRDVTDQVFSFTGEGDPSGIRRVRAQRLEPYPLGPVTGHVGIWDPVANRVIVHGGGLGDDEPERFGATWALQLGGIPRWEELLPTEASPSHGVRAMGYDPTTHRAIEITEDEDGEGLAVYALTLERGAERWDRLSDMDFAPSLRGEMVWDDDACGFHVPSARRTRCVLEHWILVVEDDDAATAVRGELDLAPPHFLASQMFAPTRSELWVYGGEHCGSPEAGSPNRFMHVVSMTR